ncbi:MAG TPA: tripartite tricarboxylate transporter substrate binding protein [Usitatibacter sp.]|nr:tripartite tricarboxylate transporter substrate binding protein [Usitatibacter sp.]
MSNPIPRRRFLAGAAGLAAAAALPSRSQGAWPQKPVKIIVGFPPGGGADAMARLIASRLPERFGQPVIVENKTGATGTIASDMVSKSAPDGYTLQLAHINSNAIGPLLVAKGRFDPVADFTPITLIGITPQMLCHHPKHKFKDVTDLIRHAKANPQKLSFASSGVGSIQHIAGEAFKLAAGVDMLHVPFKGTGEAMSALLSGQVDMTFSSTGSALPQVRAGKLTLLAVCSPRRLAAFPDVPAVSETLKGYEISTWYGLAGPAKLPREIVERIHRDVHAILGQPDIAKRLQDLDAEVSSGTPEQFAAFWKNENEKYRKLIAEAKIEA